MTSRARSTCAAPYPLSTWLPEPCPADPGAARTLSAVNEYLTPNQQLVPEDKTEREIEHAVKQVVREDVDALEDRLDELPDAA